MLLKDVPKCCTKCKKHDSVPTDEDGWSPDYHYCSIGIKMPVKKQSCKKQELKGE
jgi:hypothetical protein